MRSWLIVNGQSVPIRATTQAGVLAAVRSAVKRGPCVIAAYLGRFPTVLSPRVYWTGSTPDSNP